MKKDAYMPYFQYLCDINGTNTEIRMKWKVTLVFMAMLIGAACLTLIMTKPDRNAHYHTIKTEVAQVVSKELNNNPLFQPYAISGTMRILEASDEILKRGLFLRDHTFYNIGYIIYNGQPLPASIGFLGQVRLTVNEKDLQHLLKRAGFISIENLR